MRITFTFWIGISLLLLSSRCGEKRTIFDPYETFKKNKYNLLLNKKINYKSITFLMPQHFKEEDRNDFVIRSGDFSGTDTCTSSYFTVECFQLEDWYKLFPQDSMSTQPTLEEMNSAYLYRRYERYYGVGISQRKKLPIDYPNYFQTISAKGTEYSDRKYIQCATVVVKDKFYFFQLINTPALMKYLADDFKRILKSVKYY